MDLLASWYKFIDKLLIRREYWSSVTKLVTWYFIRFVSVCFMAAAVIEVVLTPARLHTVRIVSAATTAVPRDGSHGDIALAEV